MADVPAARADLQRLYTRLIKRGFDPEGEHLTLLTSAIDNLKEPKVTTAPAAIETRASSEGRVSRLEA